ncbi:MAG: hypothetical protein JOZ18_05615, partial [Chloroflexi bacterium]|nr:hypothetical protein [Chloroflexota bacterium]
MFARDLSGRRLPTIEIDYSPAYEFLMTLIVFSEKKGYEYEVGNEWFDIVRTKAGADLVTAIGMFDSDCNHVWKHLLGLAYESEPPRDVHTFIANVEATDPLELRLHLIGYYRRDFRRKTPLDVILRAAEGDPEAQRQYLKTSFPEEGDWRELLHRLFTLDAEETKSILLDILQRWYD